jgi:hypothetical protein
MRIGTGALRLALFPADKHLPNFAAAFGVQVRLKEMELHRPRQWGACWLACHLYEQLELDEFWAEYVPDSREGTSWRHTLQTLVCYRLIDPGSEWRLHRQWFDQSAMGDLPACNLASPVASARTRTDPTGCVGQIRHYADARCALSDYRWPQLDIKPLHASGNWSQSPA